MPTDLPPEFDQAYWENRYRPGSASGQDDQHGRRHHGPPDGQHPDDQHPDDQHNHGGHGFAPNPHLVRELTDATPGVALDAGCGEGANAMWLAQRGWRVIAVDIAGTALSRARNRAETVDEAASRRIEWVHADLTNGLPTDTRYDLVTTFYLHTQAPREQLFDGLARTVAPGGTLLIVGHHPADPHSRAHASGPAVHFTADDITAAFDSDRWEVRTAETRTRSVTRPDSHEMVLHDTVFRARRRS